MRIRAWVGVAGAESSPGKGTSGEEAQGEEEEAIRRVMELKSVPGVGGGRRSGGEGGQTLHQVGPLAWCHIKHIRKSLMSSDGVRNKI